MRLELKEFRLPLILTVLMLAVISYWAWQTWHRIDDHEMGREQHEAYKISDILMSAMSALDQDGHLSREDVGQRLGLILATSPYQFMILQHDGRRILQAGKVPASLPSALVEGATPLDGMYIFTHRVVMPNDSKGFQVLRTDRGSTKYDGTGCEYLLSLGWDGRKDRMPPQKFIEHIIVPFVAVLLILGANATAWVMVIRNRSLFEQLEIERTRSAHLEDLGLAAAGLAHETKNPLGIISGIAQQVARDPQVPEKSRAMLETITDEIDKSVSRLGLFMTYARHRDIKVASVPVRHSVKSIKEILEPEFEAAEVPLKMECPALSIMADAEMFRQILVNLLLNSLHASSPGTAITIRLLRQGSSASIEVEDQGSGIPRDLLPRIFKPYVTGNPEGHGLGLSIVKRFAEDHGWSIAAESELGRGTVIKISGISISELPEGA